MSVCLALERLSLLLLAMVEKEEEHAIGVDCNHVYLESIVSDARNYSRLVREGHEFLDTVSVRFYLSQGLTSSRIP